MFDRRKHDASEYHRGPAGELRWNSNDAVIPPSVWAESDMADPMPACQQVERDRQVDIQIAAYKRAQRNRRPSAEERYEMRAAFGRGATVVNVITGRRTRV